MNDPVSPVPLAPIVQIGIRGLPNLTSSMISGGLYVLIAETPSARFPMLAGSLGSALKDELPCTVIAPANPELLIQRIESFGNFNAAELIAANRLQFFVMQAEFATKMFRFGADSFVQELEHFKIPENSYLVFDQADELISLHDISLALDQIDILRKWLIQRRVTALLVFSRVTEARSGTINALMDNLTGIVRLGGDRDGLELTFDYWQSPEGTIAARSYQLATLDSGLYEASTKILSSESALDEGHFVRGGEAGDIEPHFFYMDPDLGSLAKQMPGIWQRVDTLVGMMHATRNTRSATSILCFQHDTNLRQLAEAVHTLRLSLGRHAQIVVQEKGASLRYQNEALLLRLGLNLVVHRDVPNSRLPLLLESLSGQIFNRDVGINFEAALASVTPTRLRGYLLPLRFAREVSAILDRAETLNIPCAMIIGKPIQSKTMIDILTHVGLSRPGDLITADGEYCYLFLNACPQSVMLATLERILGASVDAAFDGIRFLVRREEIDPELAALSRAAEQGDLPDYSSLNDAPLQEFPCESTLEEAPIFEQVSPPPKNTSAVPVAPLLSTLARSEQRARVLPDAPILTPSARSSIAPQSKPKLAATPVIASTLSKVAMPTDVSARVSDTQAKGSPFSYNSPAPAPTFGKKEVPRATRSAPTIDSGSGRKEKTLPNRLTH
ncbi:MAG: BcsE family c-di-GMP-binding protein [Burkholderiaceae bacterium]|nr:BcsE family c-di-GMP-binding protein [Burkholderiaceae bacterium]